MTELIYELNELLTLFFSIFENLGNLPNWGFIAFAFCLLGWWMKLQKEYNDKAEADPKQLK